MPRTTLTALALAVSLGCSQMAFAAWSSTPATAPLLVTPAGNGAKILPAQDGSTYISFMNYANVMDGEPWGFDGFLQRYDANGNAQWPEPIKVVDRDKAYHSGYGAATDRDGNAYLAMDVHPGQYPQSNAEVMIYKVLKNGTPGWAKPLNLTPGARLATNGGRLTLAGGGDVLVAAWAQTESDQTVDVRSGIACFDKNGQVRWKKDVMVDGRLTFAIHSEIAGDAVYVTFEVGYMPGTPYSHYYVQKYSLSDGKELWPQMVALTSGENFIHLFDKGEHMQFAPDGEGGLVIGWRHPIGQNQGVMMLQHVKPDGSKVFPGQGLRVSGNDRTNTNPSLVYDNHTYYMVWQSNKVRTNDSGELAYFYTLKAVAVDPSGHFLWNKDGSTEPTLLKPWRESLTSGPVDNWFQEYAIPKFTLNEDDQLTLVYAETGAYLKRLYVQSVDKVDPSQAGTPTMITNGEVWVSDLVTTRSLYGQPLLTYTESNGDDGAIPFMNFDATGASGVSQKLLLEKHGPVTLKPGEEKSLALHYLDNVGTQHDGSVNSDSQQVAASGSTPASGVMNLTLKAEHLITDKATVTAQVSDRDVPTRMSEVRIPVLSPYSFAPVIKPMDAVTGPENSNIVIAAQVDTPAGSTPIYTWTQDSGVPLPFTSNGATLIIDAPFVSSDTHAHFTLSVNNAGEIASQGVDVTVKDVVPATLTTHTVSVVAGDDFTLTPEFTNARPPLTYDWVQTDGQRMVFTVDDDGVLHGTAPLQTGTLQMMVTVSDSYGVRIRSVFDVTVTAASSSGTGQQASTGTASGSASGSDALSSSGGGGGGSFGVLAGVLAGLGLMRKKFRALASK